MMTCTALQATRSARGLVRIALALAFVLAAAGLAARAQTDAGPGAAPVVRVLPLDGAIGPAVADYLAREIDRAADDRVAALVIRMNTPGGLVSSMRDMVSAILSSPVPVVVYVAPQGAHAASAGTYILYASHIAAMAPGTNLGAATPINMGGGGPAQPGPGGGGAQPGDESAKKAPEGAADLKAVNDLVALIKSLAELRGRDIDWGERAVREAATLTASEALKAHVIDLIAPDLDALVAALNGREVKTSAGEITLKTAGAHIEQAPVPWATRFLMVITDPNIAFILMTLGMYGLIFELAHPGTVLPGLIGATCLVLGLYALSVLPVNVTGLALIALGIILMLVEAINPGFGAAGIGGIISFALGATFLIDSNDPQFRLAPQTIIVVTAITGGFLILVIGYALGAQRRRVTTGRESLIGRTAQVSEWDGNAGFVELDGERWRALSDEPLEPGSDVVVKSIDGLVLSIARALRGKSGRRKGK